MPDAAGDAHDAGVKRDWVTRVLGHRFTDAANEADGGAAVKLRDLRDALDTQIIALRDAFEALDDERSAAIVRRGLTPLAVRLHAGLNAAEAALAREGGAALGACIAVLGKLEASVAADPVAAYLAGNPFGISLRLAPAIADTTAAIAAAQKGD